MGDGEIIEAAHYEVEDPAAAARSERVRATLTEAVRESGGILEDWLSNAGGLPATQQLPHGMAAELLGVMRTIRKIEAELTGEAEANREMEEAVKRKSAIFNVLGIDPKRAAAVIRRWLNE